MDWRRKFHSKEFFKFEKEIGIGEYFEFYVRKICRDGNFYLKLYDLNLFLREKVLYINLLKENFKIVKKILEGNKGDDLVIFFRKE